MSDFEPSGMRVGNAEREDALRLLGEHMSAGRIDVDEYGERTAKVTTAKTRGDLVVLFNDLPNPKPAFLNPAPAPLPLPPAEPVRWERSRGSSALVPLVVLGVIAALVLTRGFAFPLLIIPLILLFSSRRHSRRDWAVDPRYRHGPPDYRRYRGHRGRSRDWDDRHWR